MELKTVEFQTRPEGNKATLSYQLDAVDKLKYMIGNLSLTPPERIDFNYCEKDAVWVNETTMEPAPREHHFRILMLQFSHTPSN